MKNTSNIFCTLVKKMQNIQLSITDQSQIHKDKAINEATNKEPLLVQI